MDLGFHGLDIEIRMVFSDIFSCRSKPTNIARIGTKNDQNGLRGKISSKSVIVIFSSQSYV